MSTQDQLLAQMRRFLDRMTVATVATVDDAGVPYAVSLYVASDSHARLHFVSDPRTMHCRHIDRQPHVHIVAHAPNVPWHQAHGIQVSATAERVADQPHREMARIYCRRFPFATTVLERAGETAFYRMIPSRIRWIDNRVYFGFKMDFAWPLPNATSMTAGLLVKEQTRWSMHP